MFRCAPDHRQGIEYQAAGVFAYDLGAFAFEINDDPSSAIRYVWLDLDGFRSEELVTAIIQGSA